MNKSQMLKNRNIFGAKKNYSDVISGRPTEAIIDLRTYKENMINIKNAVNKKIMAIVKANAYGHGAVTLSKEVEDIVDFFGVAILEEAIELISSGIKKPILVLGFVDPEQYFYAAINKIRITIYSYDQWKKWKEQIEKNSLQEPILFHIKINTGMNRLGFKDKSEMMETLKEIQETKGAKIEGIFTHFATADMPGDSLIDKQEKKFIEMISDLNENDFIIHIGNSAYALSRKNAKLFDMVRVGISGYGLLPSNEIEKEMSVKTKPILQLKTKIIHIQELNKGEKVGYGGTYEVKGKERIGIIPIGYKI